MTGNCGSKACSIIRFISAVLLLCAVTPACDNSKSDNGDCEVVTEVCGDGIDQDCDGSDLACAACADGAVTEPCECRGAMRTMGYCCGGSYQASPCMTGPISDIVPPERITTWNPGILSDDQLGLPLGDDKLPVRTEVCADLSLDDNIQTAIDACPEGQVVQLAAGTYTVSDTIIINRGIVLRGKGSDTDSGTTIVKTDGNSVIAVGTTGDTTCYGGTGYRLQSDAEKGTSALHVGTDAIGNFTVGNLALVDQIDVDPVQIGDGEYFKRQNPEGSFRSASQRVEIAAVDTAAGTLTLSSPLHWTFQAGSPTLAEVTPVTDEVIRWAGVEGLRLQGGTNPGYLGQMAGGIDMADAAYCWVKDVQTDNTIAGMHVSMTSTYRSVVRDSYFHHSARYGFGEDCYGIVMRCGAADNLIENNIVRYMNKPILFNNTGGGNVVGYNYADNAWADNDWQEVTIDTHCSFPHMELIEGNYAPHMGATTTHGNSGYLTYFRNYSSSEFAPPAVAESDILRANNVTALQLQAGDFAVNVIGNVLGTDAPMVAGDSASVVYETADSSPASIYELNAEADDVLITTLYRHGNYDYVNHDTLWDSTSSVQTLPPSLYLTARPAWWPSDGTWPWVGPDLTPMVGELPAKSRSDTPL